jgi:hypothetical protein
MDLKGGAGNFVIEISNKLGIHFGLLKLYGSKGKHIKFMTHTWVETPRFGDWWKNKH